MSGQVANSRYNIEKDNHPQFYVINNNDSSNNNKDELLLKTKIDNAVAGLDNYFCRLLAQQLSRDNAAVIADYILAMRIETNLSDNYRASIISALSALSKHHSHKKSFRQMTREEKILLLILIACVKLKHLIRSINGLEHIIYLEFTFCDSSNGYIMMTYNKVKDPHLQ
jgi:hypothetical protein